MTDEQFLNSQLYDQPNIHSKRSAALKARMNIAAEAADIGDDMQGAMPLGNTMNRFQSVQEHQKYLRQQHQQQQSWQSSHATPQYR